jgi:hypothetical protein
MTVRAHDSIIRRRMIGSRIDASLTLSFFMPKGAYTAAERDSAERERLPYADITIE